MVDTILTPDDPTYEVPEVTETEYFAVDNYFSELETDSEKGIARENLGVYGKSDVYTQVEVDNNINSVVGNSMKSHLAMDDPHQILPKVDDLIKDYVKQDGTTPFTAPQSGVEPLLGKHLTTKTFVISLLETHIKKTDPHNVMDLVKEELKQYVLSSNVYGKSEVYTKNDVDKLIKNFVRTDGTTPFTAPQSGVTPKIDQHLTTKRYVDNVMFTHEVSVDPHGFLTILNQRLSNYYKTTETYSKSETYSRAQIDQVINTLVCDAANYMIREHVNQFDPHNILKEVYKEHYIKRDGSVPFTAIQKGVEGIEDNDLATVGQLDRIKTELESQIEVKQPIWVTSGPVQTTVGFIEDENPIPAQLTFQEVMDAIFYGTNVEVSSDKVVSIGMPATVNMTIRGNALIEKAELYQNGDLIGTYSREDFLDWTVSVKSNPILVNTTFTFEVTYINGTKQTATSITNVSYGIFVGVVPKSCHPGDLTYDNMLYLAQEDPENNVFYSYGADVTTIIHKFNFVSTNEPKKITIAIPAEYNQLDYMHTLSQHFDTDAFLIETIPIIVPGLSEPVLFTYYMYNESLVAFNSEVIFKLSKHE